MPERAVLVVRYTGVGASAQLRKAVGGFLRYLQYRDKPPGREGERAQADARVEGLLRYVAHRDRSAGRGRLFDGTGTVGDEERRQLARFIARSVRDMPGQPGRDREGRPIDRRRAVYRFILSPERAEGLDLRHLSRAALAQLEQDAGGELRWIAAEHRNTAHPHTHLVVAARREISPGQFRSVMLTRPRLARMKEAIARELERQRGGDRGRGDGRAAEEARRNLKESSKEVEVPHRHLIATSRSLEVPRSRAPQPRARRSERRPRESPQRGCPHLPYHLGRQSRALRRLAARYRWEAEREAGARQREGRERDA